MTGLPMWKDRSVLIAGGTGGFGLVLSQVLAARGCVLTIVGRSPERLLAACEKIRSLHPGSQVVGLSGDLSQEADCQRIVDACRTAQGRIDDVFMCTGRSGRGLLLNAGVMEISQSLVDNLHPALHITRQTATDLMSSRGHLVYMGSLSGKLVTPFMGVYCVAKSALAAYVDGVRLELGPRGIHVLLVSCGPIQRFDAIDGKSRYDLSVSKEGLPVDAALAGGGVRLAAINPDWLAEKILDACRDRKIELVVPRQAAWLAGLIELFPSLGRAILFRKTRKRS
ncbi:MAG: SDR family NAD(P)-dependent oxidoreductase [Planctomycetota bacterium]|nr:MAG: SDR family NAD(P)-dependent oxidoreductase [Planctomycetota bacterium]